jgi:hypothetical protein
MVCGTFRIRQVPAAEVDDTIALYKANVPPPTSVTSAPDGQGTFTITAVFPPCPENTEHSGEGRDPDEEDSSETGGDDSGAGEGD